MEEDFKVPTLPGPAAKIEKQTNQEQKDIHIETAQETFESSEIAAATAKCPYKIPNWSAPPSDQNVNYKFEVLKSGQIIEEIDNLQKQATWNFGRLPENDMVLAHPTISRFHAVLQYRPNADETNDGEESKTPPEGWYIYDLGSTHGTFLNKQRIPAKVFIRIRVGHMMKLGASTRSYILQGPVEDEEPASELSITELREENLKQKQQAVEEKLRNEEAERQRKENEGISWGMSDDANEETDLTHNPFASTNNEDYYATNPKQALRHFFEREDMPLEYKCDEMSLGSFVCRIDLPVDDENGRPITAEVVHKGKKKDCVFQCALEACRILDRLGVLRQRNQEPLARRKKQESDSDDDEFLDRTGDIARKKERKANTNASVTLTYEELLKQEQDLLSELAKVETSIADYQAKQKRLKQQAEAQNEEDLDSFMEHLNEDDSKLDNTEIKKLRLDHQRLKSEELRLKRLIKVAKPYQLPFPKLTATAGNSATTTASATKKQLPMVGKRNQFSKFKVVKPLSNKVTVSTKTYASDEEEVDEDENQTIKSTVNEYKTDAKIAKQTTEKKTEATTTAPKIDAKDSRVGEAVSEVKETLIEPANPFQPSEAALEGKISATEPESKDLTLKAVKEESPTHSKITKNSTLPPSAAVGDISNSAESSRKRLRQRTRTKRQDVDVEDLDEHEKEEKYAKWVPPANQTGDGLTALNEKFGY